MPLRLDRYRGRTVCAVLRVLLAVLAVSCLAHCAWGADRKPKPARKQKSALAAAGTKYTVKAAPSITYVMYLPKGRKLTDVTTVVISIPPGGSARPLSTTVADKQGWAMVGMQGVSTNIDATKRTVDQIIADLRARSGKEKLSIVFAGFSAGSRMAGACANAHLDECVGLLCMGAGTGGGALTLDEPTIPIAFIVGEKDSNWDEVTQQHREEESRGRPTKLFTHAGGHSMGTPALIAQALNWLAEAGKDVTPTPPAPPIVWDTSPQAQQEARQCFATWEARLRAAEHVIVAAEDFANYSRSSACTRNPKMADRYYSVDLQLARPYYLYSRRHDCVMREAIDSLDVSDGVTMWCDPYWVSSSDGKASQQVFRAPVTTDQLRRFNDRLLTPFHEGTIIPDKIDAKRASLAMGNLPFYLPPFAGQRVACYSVARKDITQPASQENRIDRYYLDAATCEPVARAEYDMPDTFYIVRHYKSCDFTTVPSPSVFTYTPEPGTPIYTPK